jgi:hypothetical protein
MRKCWSSPSGKSIVITFVVGLSILGYRIGQTRAELHPTIPHSTQQRQLKSIDDFNLFAALGEASPREKAIGESTTEMNYLPIDELSRQRGFDSNVDGTISTNSNQLDGLQQAFPTPGNATALIPSEGRATTFVSKESRVPTVATTQAPIPIPIPIPNTTVPTNITTKAPATTDVNKMNQTIAPSSIATYTVSYKPANSHRSKGHKKRPKESTLPQVTLPPKLVYKIIKALKKEKSPKEKVKSKSDKLKRTSAPTYTSFPTSPPTIPRSPKAVPPPKVFHFPKAVMAQVQRNLRLRKRKAKS